MADEEQDTIHEAVVVELRPQGRKLQMLRQHVGLARFVWNWTLEQHQKNGFPIGGKAGREARIKAVEARKRGEKIKWPKKLSKAELSRRWTQEVDATAPWARELCRTTVTYAIAAVDDAYQHAFRRLKEGYNGRDIGWPKFRGRQHQHRSFTLQDQSFRYGRWALKLPKMGMVPVRNCRRHDDLSRLNGAHVLRIVVTERAGRWWCSIMVRRPRPVHPKGGTGTVGMDLGQEITLSDGTIYTPPKPLARYLRWIQNWGKAMSRRKPERGEEPSRRWLRAKQNLQKMHLRAAMCRRDWIHQVSTDIARSYGTVATEGFDVRRFVSEHLGYKRHRRDILDIGWGDLRRVLAYKMNRRDKAFLQLGKHELTDQTCSRCGATDPRRDGLFRCPECGHTDIRPRNTADLLERIGRGDPPQGFGSGDGVAPAGEAGVNARGAGKAPSGGRRRRSEIGHAENAQGGTASQVSPPRGRGKKIARKTGVSRPKKTRASARSAGAE